MQLGEREQSGEAAYAMFEGRGFAAVSVTDITERAGTGRIIFVRRFGDRSEMLSADRSGASALL